jgi:hypothetical protein
MHNLMKHKRDKQAVGALAGAVAGLALVVATGAPAALLLLTALAGSFIAGRTAATE